MPELKYLFPLRHINKRATRQRFYKVFSLVIIPDHVHFIKQQLQKNVKETLQGSFLKYTAHEFLKT